MDRRARITLPDVLFLLMSLAFLAALYPVFRTFFERNAGEFSSGAAFIWQLTLPLAILVFLTLMYRKAVAGAGA